MAHWTEVTAISVSPRVTRITGQTPPMSHSAINSAASASSAAAPPCRGLVGCRGNVGHGLVDQRRKMAVGIGLQQAHGGLVARIRSNR
jgi:hypothetical protein